MVTINEILSRGSASTIFQIQICDLYQSVTNVGSEAPSLPSAFTQESPFTAENLDCSRDSNKDGLASAMLNPSNLSLGVPLGTPLGAGSGADPPAEDFRPRPAPIDH